MKMDKKRYNLTVLAGSQTGKTPNSSVFLLLEGAPDTVSPETFRLVYGKLGPMQIKNVHLKSDHYKAISFKIPTLDAIYTNNKYELLEYEILLEDDLNQYYIKKPNLIEYHNIVFEFISCDSLNPKINELKNLKFTIELYGGNNVKGHYRFQKVEGEGANFINAYTTKQTDTKVQLILETSFVQLKPNAKYKIIVFNKKTQQLEYSPFTIHLR